MRRRANNDDAKPCSHALEPQRSDGNIKFATNISLRLHEATSNSQNYLNSLHHIRKFRPCMSHAHNRNIKFPKLNSNMDISILTRSGVRHIDITILTRSVVGVHGNHSTECNTRDGEPDHCHASCTAAGLNEFFGYICPSFKAFLKSN